MIVTRTPLRVSFAGGGSDIPEFYEKHGGEVLSTTINKYVYFSVCRSFTEKRTLLKYSEVEDTLNIGRIKHPIFRECLRMFNTEGVEISSIADVPAGTGLGSSSSFTVGLVNLLSAYNGEHYDRERLADTASRIEIDVLKEPIGKQDQYAAAYGGLRHYAFNKDGTVDVSGVDLSKENRDLLGKRLMMFYLGGTRKASKILKRQKKNTSSGDAVGSQEQISKLAGELRSYLEKGDIDAMGGILDDGWRLKRTLAKGISNGIIDKYYETALDNGATGGKLLGAGGNGFMLFYVPENKQEGLVRALPELRHFPFQLDDSGSSVVYDDRMH
ncbi:MAG: hypothetical protein LBV63_02380 [Candidatus Methanoplasma sp.]|jgi:D-glycero-alpha-D-manno-heptose-7-phosphate kinase|nr:hypothetical protein [Candidatus Methanoplasma sp.]